jgi:hypothetical protein
VYVNNILIITRTKKEIAALKKLIFSRFKYYNIGLISYYLGIRVCRNCSRRTIELLIELYFEKLTSNYKCTNAIA